jgi:hypothetical protein
MGSVYDVCSWALGAGVAALDAAVTTDLIECEHEQQKASAKLPAP